MARYYVPGLTCAGCARSVTNAVKGVDADSSVNVDLATKLVTVDTLVDVGRIAKAINDAGYEVEIQAA